MHQFIRRNNTLFRFKNILMFFIYFSSCHNLFAESPEKFSTQKASFSASFKDEVVPYQVMGVFVLPNEIVSFEVNDSGKMQTYQVNTTAGKLFHISQNKWNWQAPAQKGLYPLVISQENSLDSITFNIFVMIPFKELQGEYLNGYQVGEYPNTPLKNLKIYQPPEGFIEATKEIEATPVSPHFKLNQFLCKQKCESSRYLVLEERLILKLELILEEVNKKGFKCNTFHIMSGYRTPHYNKAIGNVKYSRHCWGGAADIFIDENPNDDMMDDLNKDGKIDHKDAKVLYDIIDVMYSKPMYKNLIGGLGKYKANASHGPFVHIDVRGFHARWGD